MRYVITRANEHPVARWAGGATVELGIHPPSARCADRRFTWRISSATVDLEESVFSDFSGYIRHIMLLKGRVRLTHDGGEAVELAPYVPHTFDGGCKTRSVGKCVDFNLIHAPELQGALHGVHADAVIPCSRNGYTGVYACCDGLKVLPGPHGRAGCEETLNAGDFLLAETAPADPLCEIRLYAEAVQVKAVAVTIVR